VTIAIALTIGDGVVLGADSAVTLVNAGGYLHNVYHNAEKIFSLVKGLPLGAVTYGLAGFDGRSHTRLAKDLRLRLSDPQDPWWVNPERYTVEQVANRVKEYFFDEHYRKAYPEGGGGTAFGFLIAGYAPGASHGEIWAFDVDDAGMCSGPFTEINPEGVLLYRGEGEALHRLVRGWSYKTIHKLLARGASHEELFETLESVAPLWHAAMPIQDGIDLVRYLVDVTIGFVRYMAEPTTVAPPTDVATITAHEGFRWISRKHYFPPELNPDRS
jgi:hypothetical protein